MRNKNLLVVIMIFFVVLFNSIIYSALNSEMFINGDAHIRVDKDIRITDVKVLEQVNGAYETYNSDYSKNTTSMQVSLPSNESVMVYEVTITNKGDTDYEVTNIIEESYSNSNIKYELIDMEKGAVIDGGTTHTFKIKFTTTENNSDNKTILVLKYDFKEWIPTLYNMVAHKSKSLDTNIDFLAPPIKETSGVYEMNSTKDLEYPVYYYRGIIDNNNVNFVGFCWKIVRTTETGGVKLIYNGVPAEDGSCDNTGEASFIGKSTFNTSNTSIEDVSYVYDNGNDSEIKKVIDKWYFENMVDYADMLEDTVWCNDRSISLILDDKTYFGSSVRLNYLKELPNIECPNNNDSFSVSDQKGNGKLKYPVALLTADEATLGGNGYPGYSAFSYLNSGANYFLLSPLWYNGSESVMYGIYSGGALSYSHEQILGIGVRPSISLASGTMIKEGNGSISNPYKLVEEKIQREWEFDYIGKEQEFDVPYDGVYKLEVWGAQGGVIAYDRKGYGGYSVGLVNLDKKNKLYINVGEAGTSIASITGTPNSYAYSDELPNTYNGGGGATINHSDQQISSGGGATHIATVSGELASLSSYKDTNGNNSSNEILIVAGGGGGTSCWGYGWSCSYSGGFHAGGGYMTNALSASNSAGGHESVNGASQSSGYSFGQGENGGIAGAGGGGGWFGGHGKAMIGSGGTGYINSKKLISDSNIYKHMTCYSCTTSDSPETKTISTTNVSDKATSDYAKQRNGYTKITLIEKK